MTDAKQNTAGYFNSNTGEPATIQELNAAIVDAIDSEHGTILFLLDGRVFYGPNPAARENIKFHEQFVTGVYMQRAQGSSLCWRTTGLRTFFKGSGYVVTDWSGATPRKPPTVSLTTPVNIRDGQSSIHEEWKSAKIDPLVTYARAHPEAFQSLPDDFQVVWARRVMQYSSKSRNRKPSTLLALTAPVYSDSNFGPHLLKGYVVGDLNRCQEIKVEAVNWDRGNHSQYVRLHTPTFTIGGVYRHSFQFGSSFCPHENARVFEVLRESEPNRFVAELAQSGLVPGVPQEPTKYPTPFDRLIAALPR